MAAQRSAASRVQAVAAARVDARGPSAMNPTDVDRGDRDAASCQRGVTAPARGTSARYAGDDEAEEPRRARRRPASPSAARGGRARSDSNASRPAAVDQRDRDEHARAGAPAGAVATGASCASSASSTADSGGGAGGGWAASASSDARRSHLRRPFPADRAALSGSSAARSGLGVLPSSLRSAS